MTEACGLYVHIPFCRAKCGYCDFLSFTDGDREAYTAALVDEIRAARIEHPIDTVYIGGGTPTALPPFLLREIMRALTRHPLSPDCEFTVEANPGTLSADMLATLRDGGANRLSIGLQAWQDPLLAALGRIHTRAAFLRGYHAARAAGFDNINIDLMFALPGQTLADWLETLTAVAGLRPAHISAYSLTLEADAPLMARRADLPGEEADRAMYHAANAFLAERGYAHYELSNYAWPGCESRHNDRYWTRRPYLGFGLGAHAFDGAARWHNPESLAAYIACGSPKPREDYAVISAGEALSEAIILGLRRMEGIDAACAAPYAAEADKLTRDGLLERAGDRLRLTPLGMDLANRVFAAFI